MAYGSPFIRGYADDSQEPLSANGRPVSELDVKVVRQAPPENVEELHHHSLSSPVLIITGKPGDVKDIQIELNDRNIRSELSGSGGNLVLRYEPGGGTDELTMWLIRKAKQQETAPDARTM